MTLTRRHNRRQLRRGIVDLAISLAATLITFGFFYFGLRYLSHAFGTETLQEWHLVVVIAIMAINFVTGYFAWRRGLGQSDYHETDLFVGGLSLTGGGTVGTLVAARATAPAYLVSQVALAASAAFFKGIPRTPAPGPRRQGI